MQTFAFAVHHDVAVLPPQVVKGRHARAEVVRAVPLGVPMSEGEAEGAR